MVTIPRLYLGGGYHFNRVRMTANRVFLSIAILLFIPLTVLHAQILTNKNGNALTNMPFFNTEFIQRNHIQTIKGRFVYYQLGHSPVVSTDFCAFTFNKEGNIIQRKEFKGYLNHKDTVVTIYRYDKKGRLALLGSYNFYGAYAYSYKYDKNNHLIYRAFHQNTNIHFSDSLPFSIDKLKVIYSENSSYQQNGNQWKQSVLNSAGKPYKEIIRTYNKEGQLINETNRILRTLETIVHSYSYNEEGFIDTLKIRSTRQNTPNQTFIFTYDENKNLLSKLEYTEEKYIYQTQIVYDRKGWFISDILRQHVPTNFMDILEINTYKRFQ